MSAFFTSRTNFRNSKCVRQSIQKGGEHEERRGAVGRSPLTGTSPGNGSPIRTDLSSTISETFVCQCQDHCHIITLITERWHSYLVRMTPGRRGCTRCRDRIELWELEIFKSPCRWCTKNNDGGVLQAGIGGRNGRVKHLRAPWSWNVDQKTQVCAQDSICNKLSIRIHKQSRNIEKIAF